MKALLTVQNFGPIKDAKLDLRDVNVLIGPQASGKSTLAKLYTICKSPILFHSRLSKLVPDENEMIEFTNTLKPSIKEFQKSLDHFSIKSFLAENSIISFVSDTHEVFIRDGKIQFTDKLNVDGLMDLLLAKDFNEVDGKLKELCLKSDNFNFEYDWSIFESRELIKFSEYKGDEIFGRYYNYKNSRKKNLNLTESELKKLVKEAIRFKNELFTNKAIYIPSERTIVGLLKQASLNFRNSGIPIPPHLMDYAAQYETATFKCKELDLSFLGSKNKMKYKNENGQDRIYFDKNHSISLTESASGLQSLIPMILPIHYLRTDENHENNYSFVIEELESNLFPKAQYEVIKFLEGGRIDDEKKIDKGTNHTYTTHSPYVLSSLNNMLFAHKLGNKSKFKDEINKIIPNECWVDPIKFSAYEIRNGKAYSIFNRTTGLIKENAIDSVSEDIINDFRKIALASMDK